MQKGLSHVLHLLWASLHDGPQKVVTSPRGQSCKKTQTQWLYRSSFVAAWTWVAPRSPKGYCMPFAWASTRSIQWDHQIYASFTTCWWRSTKNWVQFFHNTKPIPKEPFILEICAGSARVTSCLQALGLSASFGVVHKKQKHAGRLLVADLTSAEGQALCWTWIKSPSCMGVFCAPPCRTCSKARGIPITLPNGYKIAGPQPLRSEECPDGVAV